LVIIKKGGDSSADGVADTAGEIIAENTGKFVGSLLFTCLTEEIIDQATTTNDVNINTNNTGSFKPIQ
jgi:hypothetical protein